MSKRVINTICVLNRENISELDSPEVIYYLDTGNVTRNTIDKLVCLHRDKDGYPSRSKRKVKDNTIIYSTVRPNQEHFGILKDPKENLIVSTGFTTIDVISPNIDPLYLYYSLTRKEITAYLQCIGENSVSSYPSINPRDIGNIKLEFPDDIDSQKKIAAVLSALDAKIECNNRINAELEAMAKTLYDYWFIQFNFPDHNGQPYKSTGGKMVYNSTLKREIPVGWNARKIGDIANVKAGGDKPSNYIAEKSKIHTIPIYSNGINNEGLYGYTNKAVILRPSITVSARGTIGYTVLRLKPFVPIIRLIVLTPQDTNSLKFFEESIKQIGFDNSGSVQQQLTVPQISEILISYPTPDILAKFSNIISASVNKIELLKEQNVELNNLRDWLLPMLMNGQVTVV